MSWDYYEAAELKEEIRHEIAKRKKRGEKFEVLDAPHGNTKLVRTFWGKAWCENLESYSDYASRLPRGRSYLRQGNVYNLVMEPGLVSATVAGSYLYEVEISIQPLSKAAWAQLKEKCTGQVGSLLDLLSGKLGEGVLRAVTDRESGLFPKPKEIRLSCSCPDAATMCKHVAAVLYGVGVKLETQPDLFFVLRSVDPSELLSAHHDALSQAQGSDAALEGEDLSALFGITLESPQEPAAPAPKKKPALKKKPVIKKTP